MYFEYGNQEIEYLKQKDKVLAQVIEQVGHVYRPLDDDLFSSVIHHIIGQQISTKAQKTIWNRMLETYREITVTTLSNTDVETLQSLGMTFRKAEYIMDFVHKINAKEFDLHAIQRMSDEEAIQYLCSLKGIGEWTAEMILLHALQRKDILSYKDLAIIRGLKVIYHHRKIDHKLFMKYKRRYHPYGSIASLYIWQVASNKLER